MSRGGIKAVNKNIQKKFDEMLKRANLVSGFLNRTVYKIYQKRQEQRWISENSSEGSQWKALNPRYAEWKKKKFAQYPGGGRKMMIATGRLKDAVIGKNNSPEHRKIVQGNSLIIRWTTPYSVYTEDVRPVNVWDKKQNDEIMREARAYLLGGKR